MTQSLLKNRYYYFTDEETKEELDKMKEKGKSIASASFKVKFNLLRNSNFTESQKYQQSLSIIDLILKKKKEFIEKKEKLSGSQQKGKIINFRIFYK